MIHRPYFNNHNVLKHDDPESGGVTAVPKNKAKHTTLRYNIAKHSLITTIATTFKPDSKH